MTDHQVIDFSACRLLSESRSADPTADTLPTDCRMQAKSGCSDSADSGCDFDTELPTAAPEIWKINREGPRDGTTSASSPPSAGQSTYNFSSCSSEERPFHNAAGAFETYNLLESSSASSKAPLHSVTASQAPSPRGSPPAAHGSLFFTPTEQSSRQSNSSEAFCGAKFPNSLQDMYDAERSFLSAGTAHFPRSPRLDQDSVASARRSAAKTQKRGTKQVSGKMMKIARASSKESESPAGVMKSTAAAAADAQSPGASYKYLSWREKDRRRRFREEWKSLWLVVPYGSYEVMCLLCHKIMTQRKLDTIKRHTIRRHTELLSMSELERQRLYYELTAHRLHRLGDKPAQEGPTTEESGESNALPFGAHFSSLAPMLRAPTMGPKLGGHCRQACGSRNRLSMTGSRPSIQKARALCQGARGRSTRIGHRIAGASKVMSAACPFSPRDSAGLSAFPDAYLIAQQKRQVAEETRLKHQPSDSQSHSGIQGTPPFESETDTQGATFLSRFNGSRPQQILDLIQSPVSNENPSLRTTYIPTSSRSVCEAPAHPTKVFDEGAAPRPTTKLFNASGPQPGTEMCRKLPFLAFLENALLRRSLARGFEGAEVKPPTGLPNLDAFPPPCSPDIARVMKCFMDLQKGLSAKPNSTYQPRPMASSHPRPNNHKDELELPFMPPAAQGPASRFCNMAALSSTVNSMAPIGARCAGRLPTMKPRRDQTPTTDSLFADLQTHGLLRPTKPPLTQVMNPNRCSPYWDREGFLGRTKPPSSRSTFAGCCRLQADTAATGFDPRAFHRSPESHPRADVVFEPARTVGRHGNHRHLAEGTVAEPASESLLNLNQPPNKNPFYCPSLFGHAPENTWPRSQLVSPTCIARLLQSMGSGQAPLLAPPHALNRPPTSTETPREDMSGGDSSAQSNTEGTSLTERLNRLVNAWDIAAVDGRQIRS